MLTIFAIALVALALVVAAVASWRKGPFGRAAVAALLVALTAANARAWVEAPVLWGGTLASPGTATTIHADAGANGSSPFQTPNVPMGCEMTIATPGSSMNGGTVYTPAFFQQASNDLTNWVTVDAGAVPGTGGNAACPQVSDAGPYQCGIVLAPLPYQYSRIISTAVTAAGELSATCAHP